ncbi:hypothetical protein ACOSQ3_022796 [Xanthoceras sorbifolium]
MQVGLYDKLLNEIHKRIANLKIGESSSNKNINVLTDINVLPGDNRIFEGHAFDGKSIVEWNIDGQSEYQILQTLKHMMMFAQFIYDRMSEQLIKCPSLSHFRWYKDVFFSKVFQRKDSSMDFWKERFLAGLPTLFAERVRTRIRNNYGGSIPFHLLTYGDLSTEVVAEGLAICTEQKLQRKMDKGSTKKTMRDFCEQYGYNESFSKPPKDRSKSKKFRSYKKRNSSCTTKEKINAPNCSEKMKHEVNYIDDVPNTDSDSESTESSSSSDEEEQCDCNNYKSILKLNGLSINVLKEEDNLILDCVDAIDDPVEKQSALENYMAMAREQKPSNTGKKPIEIPKQHYSFREVIQRVQKENEASRQPTLAELIMEMNSFKEELKKLKKQQ